MGNGPVLISCLCVELVRSGVYEQQSLKIALLKLTEGHSGMVLKPQNGVPPRYRCALRDQERLLGAGQEMGLSSRSCLGVELVRSEAHKQQSRKITTFYDDQGALRMVLE